MKVAVVLALLAAAADAYIAPTMALGRKKAAPAEKAAPAPTGLNSRGRQMLGGAGSTNLLGKEQTYFGGPEVKSIALPYTTTTLDGTLAGDVGFDPFNLAKTAPGCWFLGEKYKTVGLGTLTWYREAELMHGTRAPALSRGSARARARARLPPSPPAPSPPSPRASAPSPAVAQAVSRSSRRSAGSSPSSRTSPARRASASTSRR